MLEKREVVLEMPVLDERPPGYEPDSLLVESGRLIMSLP